VSETPRKIGRGVVSVVLIVLGLLTVFIGMIATTGLESYDSGEPLRGGVMIAGGGSTVVLVIVGFFRKYADALWIAALVITVTLALTLPPDLLE
jgi:hypothetical protein